MCFSHVDTRISEFNGVLCAILPALVIWFAHISQFRNEYYSSKDVPRHRNTICTRVTIQGVVKYETSLVFHRFTLIVPLLAEFPSIGIQVSDYGTLQDGGRASRVPGVAELFTDSELLLTIERVLVRCTDVTH